MTCSLVRAAVLAACGVLSVSGCGSEPAENMPNGQAGSAATVEPPVAGPADAKFAAEPTVCPELPPVGAAQTGRLALALTLELGGAPLALGEAKSDGLGGLFKLSFLAYYLTNFQLLDAKGEAHPAVLLGADDVPLAYGLRLVNVDDPSTQQLRLGVEPGQYQGLVFSVGVPAVCNALEPTTRGYPLSFETEMNWGWTMLNVRLEGSQSSAQGSFVVQQHLGFPQDYRSVQAPAALDLSQGMLSRTLVFDLQHVLGIGGTVTPLPYPQVVDALTNPGTFLLR